MLVGYKDLRRNETLTYNIASICGVRVYVCMYVRTYVRTYAHMLGMCVCVFRYVCMVYAYYFGTEMVQR